jgi:hypothetical protein
MDEHSTEERPLPTTAPSVGSLRDTILISNLCQHVGV